MGGGGKAALQGLGQEGVLRPHRIGNDLQSRGVGVGHEGGRAGEGAVAVDLQDLPPFRSHGLGVAGDGLQPPGPDHVGIAHARQVGRSALGRDQLDAGRPGEAGQGLQGPDLEALHQDRGGGRVEALGPQRRRHDGLEGHAETAEMGGVLHLRAEADGAAQPRRFPPGQGRDLGEGEDSVLAVVAGAVRAQLGQALAGAQGLQLGQGEVLGEPALDPLSVNVLDELRVRTDVRGPADLVLVPGHEGAVPGQDEVRLDDVGALGDGEAVGAGRVLWPVAAGAPVGDHLRAGGGGGGAGRGHDGSCGGEAGPEGAARGKVQGHGPGLTQACDGFVNPAPGRSGGGAQALEDQGMEVQVGGADAAGGEDVVAPLGGGDLAARLGDQQDARRQVPGAEVALPEAVHAAGGHPGQVEGRGAEPADPGDALADLVQLLQELGVLAVAEEGNAGGEDGLVHALARGDAQAVVIDEAALALLGPAGWP